MDVRRLARPHFVGRLDGVNVVLALTGVGLVNAAQRTSTLLDSFDIAAVLFSGVAGSRYRIADVVIATQWTEFDGPEVIEVNRALFALAKRGRKRVPPGSLETCTPVPPTDPSAPLVCMPYDPAVILEGHGFTADDFGGRALPCIPGGGEVLGCEVPDPSSASAANATLPAAAPRTSAATAITAAAEIPEDLVDMETATVARVALERGVPFLGVRGVSDGAGDPLGDRGFPVQFFDYYQLAANNSALVTRAVVAEIARLARKQSARPICRLLAKGRWRRAAAGISAPKPTTPAGPGY